jgi:large subunit ribosomal protein L10
MQYAQKQEAVGDIKASFADVMSVVIADYRGLDVPTVTAMREEFKKAGCTYKVLKNTLVKLAVKDSPLEPMQVLLSGPTAVIWSNESPSAPAKLAVKYAKDLKHFEIKGGFFDGQVLDAQGVEQLSRLPSKEELQAKLLMTFLAAPQGFVRTLVAGPINFLHLLNARKRQLEQG